MDILRPEEETLDLLATELGFIISDHKDLERKTPDSQKNVIDLARNPATIKPFTQLT